MIQPRCLEWSRRSPWRWPRAAHPDRGDVPEWGQRLIGTIRSCRRGGGAAGRVMIPAAAGQRRPACSPSGSPEGFARTDDGGLPCTTPPTLHPDSRNHRGLYDPRFERDACGVAVATLTGIPTHQIVEQALTALESLEHRGASGFRTRRLRRRCRHPDAAPRRLLPGGGVQRSAGSVPTRSEPRSCCRTRGSGGRDSRHHEEIADDEGLMVIRMSICPPTPAGGRHRPCSVMPASGSALRVERRPQRDGRSEPFCLRKRSERESDVTSVAVVPGPSPTRECSPPHNWASSTPICATTGTRQPSVWFTLVLHQHLPVRPLAHPVLAHRPQR